MREARKTPLERLVEQQHGKAIKEILIAMVNNGLTLEEMGEQCDVSYHTIRVWLRKHQVSGRSARMAAGGVLK